ncbi:tyrosine-protein kinase Etk/Wzc [Dysgonomonadaceae bacterium PH5-43]|nr:tyrosine-protein kinase Etk/Wzc [Dysgonomonadaceae bacterium PH5-43]
MDTQNKSTKEQIIDAIQYALKHWIYFVISLGVCGVLGIIYLKTAPRVWSVKAQVSLRDDESLTGGNISSNSSLLSSFGFGGGSQNIEDESIKLRSHGNMKQLVENFELNKIYEESSFLGIKKTKLYDHSPIALVVDPLMNDTITAKIQFKLNIKDDKIKIKMKAGKKKVGTFEVASLPATIETIWGNYTFEKTPLYDNYSYPSNFIISYYNYDVVAQFFQEAMNIDFMKKTSDLINLEYSEENTVFAKKLLRELINIYNTEWIKDKSLVTRKTTEYIEYRLNEVERLLLNADTGIEQFKESYNLTEIEADVQYYLTSSGELQSKLIEAQTQLDVANILINHIENESNKYSLIPFNLVLNDASIASAITNYNNHLIRRSDMLKESNGQSAVIGSITNQIDLLRNNLIKSVKNIQEGLEISLASIKKKDSEFNDKLKNVPKIEKDYINLKREQRLQQNLYVFLLEMREQSAIKGVNILPKLKIINEPYIVNKRVSPSLKTTALMIVFFGGGVIPIVLIYLVSFIKKKKNKQ